MPIVLDSFDGTHLTDVTGQYPSLDPARSGDVLQGGDGRREGVNSTPSFGGIGPFGALAAWVADECALNQGAKAWRTVLSFQAAGELSNKVYYADTLIKGSYVSQLRTFLLKGEYCTGQFGE